MTPDHVDGRSALAPALDGAAFDAKVVQPGELDRVVVAVRPDVAEREILEHDVMRRRIIAAPVVDVQTVGLALDEHQIAQLDVGHVAQMQTRLAAANDRRTLGIGGGDEDRPALGSLHPVDEHAALVCAGSDEDLRARFRFAQGAIQRFAVIDAHGRHGVCLVGAVGRGRFVFRTVRARSGDQQRGDGQHPKQRDTECADPPQPRRCIALLREQPGHAPFQPAPARVQQPDRRRHRTAQHGASRPVDEHLSVAPAAPLKAQHKIVASFLA